MTMKTYTVQVLFMDHNHTTDRK